MFNIIHLANSRGIRDTASRQPRPTAQPAGLSHLTLVMGGASADPRTQRPPREALPPGEPHPSGG